MSGLPRLGGAVSEGETQDDAREFTEGLTARAVSSGDPEQMSDKKV